MRAARLLLLTLLLAALAACSGKGKVREPTELQDIESPAFKVDTEWRSSAGKGSGKFYTGLRLELQDDGLYAADITGRVYALNPLNGRRLWITDTDAPITSGPSAAGDAVLVGATDGGVISLRRTDGGEIWRRVISSEVLSTPVGDGDVVVARAVDGKVYGLSATSGDFVWAFDRTVPALVLRGMSPPLLMPGRVVVGLENGRVNALDLSTGRPIWEQAISVPTGRTELDRITDIDAAIIAGPSCLYVASYGGEVACVEPFSSQVQWRRTIKTYNNLALGGDKLFVTDESGVLWALDAQSGAAAWKQEALLYRKLSPPVYFNGYVVVGDLEGYLHWMDASDGRIVARSRMGSDPIVSQPVAGPELLYVMNQKGRIAAVRPRQ